MTYLELKKVLRRRIHDVADLKAVKRNKGALITRDNIASEAGMLFFRSPCPRRSHSFL